MHSGLFFLLWVGYFLHPRSASRLLRWCHVRLRLSREMEAFASTGNQYDFSIVIQVSSLAFVLGFWVLSIFVMRIFEASSEMFRNMGIRHKRNVVTYVIEIAASTYTFIALTAFLPRLITVTSIEDPLDEEDM